MLLVLWVIPVNLELVVCFTKVHHSLNFHFSQPHLNSP